MSRGGSEVLKVPKLPLSTMFGYIQSWGFFECFDALTPEERYMHISILHLYCNCRVMIMNGFRKIT